MRKLAYCLVPTLLMACSAAEPGTLEILVEPEDTIISGIEPGDDTENIRDGWRANFNRYIAVLGHIHLVSSVDEEIEQEVDTAYAIDLTQLPAAGEALWEVEDLDEGSWEFFYELSGGAHDVERHSSVSKEDFDRIVEGDLSYLISGQISQDAGVSCPPKNLASPGAKESQGENEAGDPCYENPTVSFELEVSAETSYGPCEIDGKAGVVVTSGKTQTAAITIHGDHLFFDGFPEGSEAEVERRAQWLADSDLNLDGVVTSEELEAIAPSDLAALEGVELGGSPITLKTMSDYVKAQLKTQGHLNGEGECPVDGKAHEHGHDEEEHEE